MTDLLREVAAEWEGVVTVATVVVVAIVVVSLIAELSVMASGTSNTVQDRRSTKTTRYC